MHTNTLQAKFAAKSGDVFIVLHYMEHTWGPEKKAHLHVNPPLRKSQWCIWVWDGSQQMMLIKTHGFYYSGWISTSVSSRISLQLNYFYLLNHCLRITKVENTHHSYFSFFTKPKSPTYYLPLESEVQECHKTDSSTPAVMRTQHPRCHLALSRQCHCVQE
jgi:hypothetical protein